MDDLDLIRQTLEEYLAQSPVCANVTESHASDKPGKNKWRIEGTPDDPLRIDGQEIDLVYSYMPFRLERGSTVEFHNPKKDRRHPRHAWADFVTVVEPEVSARKKKIRLASVLVETLEESVAESQGQTQLAQESERQANATKGAYDSRLAGIAAREGEVSRREEDVSQREAEAQAERESLRQAEGALSAQESRVRDYEPYLRPLFDLRRLSPKPVPDAAPLDRELGESLVRAIESLGIRRDFAITYLLSLLAGLVNGRFLLLAGHVGVGKSRLVEKSGELLGGRFRLVPVRPSWLDPSDLFGFYDPVAGSFRASPFTHYVREARDDDRLHLVLLDEMNIARIENYAADLLASLGPDRKTIPLHIGGNDPARDRLAHAILGGVYREVREVLSPEQRRDVELLLDQSSDSSLELKGNVVFCGTLNVDDTTEGLSPKMLDRSFLLRFPDTDFSRARTESPPVEVPVSSVYTCLENPFPGDERWGRIREGADRFKKCLVPLSQRVREDFEAFVLIGGALGFDPVEVDAAFLFSRIFPRIRVDAREERDEVKELVRWIENRERFPAGLASIDQARECLLRALGDEHGYVSYQNLCG